MLILVGRSTLGSLQLPDLLVSACHSGRCQLDTPGRDNCSAGACWYACAGEQHAIEGTWQPIVEDYRHEMRGLGGEWECQLKSILHKDPHPWTDHLRRSLPCLDQPDLTGYSDKQTSLKQSS